MSNHPIRGLQYDTPEAWQHADEPNVIVVVVGNIPEGMVYTRIYGAFPWGGSQRTPSVITPQVHLYSLNTPAAQTINLSHDLETNLSTPYSDRDFGLQTNDGGVKLQSVISSIKLVQPLLHSLTSSVSSLISASVADTVSRLLQPYPSKSTSATKLPDKEPHQEALDWVKESTGLSWGRIGDLLGVSRQTVNDWKNGEHISEHNLRRLLATREVLERAQRRHPRPIDLTAWLETPQGSNARTPATLFQNGKIDEARLLAITRPSFRMRKTPEWARRPIPETFQGGGERRDEGVPPEEVDPFGESGD
jgi:hypothetical protein